MEVLAWPADLTREAEVTAPLGANPKPKPNPNPDPNPNPNPNPLEECAEAARRAGAAEVLAWPADLTRISPPYLTYISPRSPLYLP